MLTVQNNQNIFILTTDNAQLHENVISNRVIAKNHDSALLTSVNVESNDTAVSNCSTAEHHNTILQPLTMQNFTIPL